MFTYYNYKLFFNNKFSLLVFCLLLFIAPALSQSKQTDKPVFYSVAPYYGYFQVHTKVLSPFRGSHPSGINFEVSQLLLTNKAKNTNVSAYVFFRLAIQMSFWFGHSNGL